MLLSGSSSGSSSGLVMVIMVIIFFFIIVDQINTCNYTIAHGTDKKFQCGGHLRGVSESESKRERDFRQSTTVSDVMGIW